MNTFYCFSTLVVIVNYGSAKNVCKIANKHNVHGVITFLGKGTINHRILKFLNLNDIKKEIILMISEKEILNNALEEINESLQLEKPNHGIAFFTDSKTLSLNKCSIDSEDERGSEDIMYNSIFIIVNKGRGSDVMDVATEAGAKGGTIINARGAGSHDVSKLFNMYVEPEKEIVLILSESTYTNIIVDAINEKLEFEKAGGGIMFVQDVSRAVGLA